MPGCLSLSPEFAQIHVHWVSDVIQPSHPLLPPYHFAFNLSQHQGLFQWVSSSHQVAKVIGASASASVLPMNIQDWFPLGLTGSPCSPRDSQESSPTPQFKSISSSVLSLLYGPALTPIHDHWKYTALTIHTFVSEDPFIDQITTNSSEPCVNPVASHQTQRKNPEQVRTQCIQLSSIISDG